MGLLIRLEVEPQANFRHWLRDNELPVWVLVGPWLRVLPHLENQLDGVPGHAPVRSGSGVKAKDLEIPWEPTGANAPLEPPPSQIVQLSNAVGNHKRVMVGHTGDPSAENNVLRPGQRSGDELIWGRDVFPDRGEMLANPGFPVA